MRSPIRGQNSNATHKGTVYHIQTEDMGVQRCFFTTHVFCNGMVLLSKKSTYAVDDPTNNIQLLMAAQHNDIVKKIELEGLKTDSTSTPPPLPISPRIPPVPSKVAGPVIQNPPGSTRPPAPKKSIPPLVYRMHIADPVPDWFQEVKQAHQQNPAAGMAHCNQPTSDGMVF